MTDPTGLRLRMLWQAAKRCRCRVLENRGFKGPPDEERWFCTLELQAAGEGDERPVLTTWEQRINSARRFYVVEECPREAMEEEVHIWIEDLALKAESRGTWGA